MQTFLPYSSFVKSASCLDSRRLGKQRVEALQILPTLSGKSSAWIHHPAVKMWKGFESALAFYALCICEEWRKRGYKDTCLEKILDASNLSAKQLVSSIPEMKFPSFCSDEAFILAHRSNLLRKDFNHYSQFNWRVEPNLPYIWPEGETQ